MLDQERVPSPERLRHISNLALEVVSTLEETFLVSDMTAPPGFPRYADSELFLPCRTLARELKPENLWSDGPPSILVAGWPLALGRSLDWLRGAFLELLKTLRLEPLMTLARPSLSRQDKGPVLGIPKDPSSPFYNEPICVGKDWPPKVDRTLVESIRAAAHGVLEILEKPNGNISSKAVVVSTEGVEMVERFVLAVEAFRQKHCDPDHPKEWLTPERKFYDEYHKAAENRNALIDMLVPKIGVDESQAIMHRLAELVWRLCRFIQRAKQHEQSGATDCRENDLRDIRNAQRDADFERVYEALRCSVAIQTIVSNGSRAAEDNNNPERISNIAASKLYAELTGTQPNAPWIGKKLTSLGRDYWTERDVARLAVTIQKKRKRKLPADEGGRFKCATCSERCKKPFGPLKECRICFVRRHGLDDASMDATPL